MLEHPHMPPINATRSSVAVRHHLAVAGWGTGLTVAALTFVAVIPLLPTVTLHNAIRIAVITVAVAFAILATLLHLTPPKRSKDGF
jgi:VIT1/CCC1 family predicted Fe2+/Mn2+ transporter